MKKFYNLGAKFYLHVLVTVLRIFQPGNVPDNVSSTYVTCT